MPRRKPGTLFPLEIQILDSGLALQREAGTFYGFALAKRLAADNDQLLLSGHGTLYKACTDGRGGIAGIFLGRLGSR
jgi:PadR family transcriptional regulator PadR